MFRNFTIEVADAMASHKISLDGYRAATLNFRHKSHARVVIVINLNRSYARQDQVCLHFDERYVGSF